MRKAEKKTVLEFVQTLFQAHEQIKGMIDKNDTAGALDLLIQCQQEAIQLGLLIERAEGEGFITVNFLEEYCELTYQLHERIGIQENQNIESYRNKRIDNAYNKLHRKLMKIECSIKNDIRQQLEVVFLPYHASMWDSLESIWKAADNDGDCDVYVIPIPYYDKNPDGTFREEHWDGDLYPDYVPITKYDDYDFAERRPDMIFIHNPYDHCNHATSVSPIFYSKNLKQFTDKLIYVPYFILDEISPNNQQAVDGIEHMCILPGVIHANKVVVQSENIRQIYINVLTKITGKAMRDYWENKIAGFGSPKVDRVLNSKKEELQIPEEWLNIIQKSDGSWKKIVLYNTSISALLQHSDKMLEKMKDVFIVFKEHRQEVALLWRPHPLIKATIESMRHQLWKEYQELVVWYLEEGWGIYDDSADMDRAAVLSDAYYGDKSSIVYLFSKVDKVAMIQSVQGGNLLFSDCSIVENNLYFYSISTKEIMKYDLFTGKTLFVSENNEISNVDTMISDNENLYMLEISGRYLVKYSLKTDQYERIDIFCDMEKYWNFAGMAIYKNKVFVFPRFAEAIIELDVNNQHVYKETALYKDLASMNYEEGPFFSWGIQNKNEMLLIGEKGKLVVKYRLDTAEYRIYLLPNLKEKCLSATLSGDTMYLLGRLGKIYSWRIEAPDVEEIVDLKSDDEEYARIIVVNETAFILPQLGEKILLLSLRTKDIRIFDEYPEDFVYQTPKNWSKYCNYCEDDQYYYFAMQSANYMLCIDKANECIKWLKITIPFSEEQTVFYMSNNKILDEKRASLSGYLSLLEQKHYSRNVVVRSDVGESIWKKIQ